MSTELMLVVSFGVGLVVAAIDVAARVRRRGGV